MLIGQADACHNNNYNLLHVATIDKNMDFMRIGNVYRIEKLFLYFTKLLPYTFDKHACRKVILIFW